MKTHTKFAALLLAIVLVASGREETVRAEECPNGYEEDCNGCWVSFVVNAWAPASAYCALSSGYPHFEFYGCSRDADTGCYLHWDTCEGDWQAQFIGCTSSTPTFGKGRVDFFEDVPACLAFGGWPICVLDQDAWPEGDWPVPPPYGS